MTNKKELPVIEVRDLNISFSTDHGRLHAVRGVNFELYKGEVLAIVGESGSGKSVSAKAIMGILPPNGRIEDGEILYGGEDLTQISEEEFHRIRGKKVGMIFQDPLSSLNPIMRIGKQITEAILINGNKLKEMYRELIAPEVIALSNEKTKVAAKIDRSAFELHKLAETHKASHQALKAKYGEDKDGLKVALDKLRADYASAKATHKELVKSTKAATKLVQKELKAELKVAKKAAKVEVATHARTLKKDYIEQVTPLKLRLKQTSNRETKKAIKTEINVIKTAYIDKTRLTKTVAKQMAVQVMEEVGIPNAARRYKQFPFEFSGGMRQRIVIAIALIQNPDILICDEPTTALDVTIQAQILELILKLKRERELSVIFITHDLGVVANMADRVAVMYAGKIVEYGKADEIFYDPRHPYTWALLSSIPDVDSKERLEAIPGTPPNLVYPPQGDAFALRSKYAMAVDFIEEAPVFKISETHYAQTWLLDERAPKVEMPKIVSERIRISLEKAGKKDGK